MSRICLPASSQLRPPSSQVLSRKLYLPAVKAGEADPPKIVAVDLQPMAPIEGVIQLQGDITSEATAAAVSRWGGRCGRCGKGFQLQGDITSEATAAAVGGWGVGGVDSEGKGIQLQE